MARPEEVGVGDGDHVGALDARRAVRGERGNRERHRHAVIAALAARSPSTIEGSDAVVISYPGFFDTLDRLVA